MSLENGVGCLCSTLPLLQVLSGTVRRLNSRLAPGNAVSARSALRWGGCTQAALCACFACLTARTPCPAAKLSVRAPLQVSSPTTYSGILPPRPGSGRWRRRWRQLWALMIPGGWGRWRTRSRWDVATGHALFLALDRAVFHLGIGGSRGVRGMKGRRCPH